jgi:hypothetical protein
MALAEPLEKGSDGDLRCEMIGFVAQWLMDADVRAPVGTAHGERSETRENWRHGYCDMVWRQGALGCLLAFKKCESSVQCRCSAVTSWARASSAPV